MPTYDVRKEPVDTLHTLVVHAEVAPADIAGIMGDAFPRVLALITKKGLSPTTMPFARYNGFGDTIKLEMGMAVGEKTEGEGDIEAGELPGGDAAVTMHVGPYDELPQAHAALMSWAFANKRQPNGGPYEIYETDPGEEPDASKWMTRVVLPLVPE